MWHGEPGLPPVHCASIRSRKTARPACPESVKTNCPTNWNGAEPSREESAAVQSRGLMSERRIRQATAAVLAALAANEFARRELSPRRCASHCGDDVYGPYVYTYNVAAVICFHAVPVSGER
ncbi:hypothetical protein MRX96_013006 [Rhipicephalus microplus]